MIAPILPAARVVVNAQVSARIGVVHSSEVQGSGFGRGNQRRVRARRELACNHAA